MVRGDSPALSGTKLALFCATLPILAAPASQSMTPKSGSEKVMLKHWEA